MRQNNLNGLFSQPSQRWKNFIVSEIKILKKLKSSDTLKTCILYIQDMYSKNFKTLLQGVKENLEKWRFHIFRWEGSILLSVIPKLIYRLSIILIKILGSF